MIAIGLTGDPVPRSSRSGAITQKNDQRPGLVAEPDEILKLQVIKQMQAHRVDREHVHGEVHALGGAGRGVVVAVAAQYRDPALGHELQRGGMQPGAGAGGVPRAQLGPALAVPDPHEEQVALADADLLRCPRPRARSSAVT